VLDAPTPAYLNDLTTVVSDAARGWEFSPVVFDFLSQFGRRSIEIPSLSSALTSAMHDLDETLGVKHESRLASSMFDSPPYLAFAHHLISRADEFAAQYNTALAEYRQANRIKSTTRPMPDLSIGENCREIPFWHDDLQKPGRSRARVQKVDGKWSLLDFQFDPASDGWEAAERLGNFLRQHGLRLPPRALTLTLFMRLLMADQFVHGIGGARYDQVTDTLIARYFGIAPPNFCVTTATLFFPAAAGRSRVCLPCMAMEGHRLAHSALGAEKKPWLDRIAAAPRGSAERQIAFSRMHTELTTARPGDVRLRSWESRYKEAAEQHSQEQAWFDRELFYAIQPRERLSWLISRYDAAFA